MKLNYITGDMVKHTEKTNREIFLHGCNCFHTMGAGIAKQLSNKYPGLLDADKTTEYADYDKLGTYSYIIIQPKEDVFEVNHIFNCYTQYEYGNIQRKHNPFPDVNYHAIRMIMHKIKMYCLIELSNEERYIINMPKIGCGLAGGDWNIVEQIIKEEFEGYDKFVINVWEL